MSIRLCDRDTQRVAAQQSLQAAGVVDVGHGTEEEGGSTSKDKQDEDVEGGKGGLACVICQNTGWKTGDDEVTVSE